MKIEMHIERVIVDGLPMSGAARASVHDTLVTELTRLLGRGELAAPLARGGAIARLKAPETRLPAHEQVGSFGEHLARSIHTAIGVEFGSRPTHQSAARVARRPIGRPRSSERLKP